MKVLIDYGHGGMINGQYVTAPSKMFTFPDGLTVFEGVLNRAVAHRLMSLLEMDQIEYEDVVRGADDISLSERVRRANQSNGDLYISIHFNAGGGTGIEVFTSPGTTQSDRAATYFVEAIQQHLPNTRLRTDFSDGDADKEAKFTVLTKTRMPAILSENGFFDNRSDVEQILQPDYQEKLAQSHLYMIKKFFGI